MNSSTNKHQRIKAACIELELALENFENNDEAERKAQEEREKIREIKTRLSEIKKQLDELST